MRVLNVVVTGENKVNSYSDELKMGWVCKFGVEMDKKTFNKLGLSCAKLSTALASFSRARS